MRFLKKTEREEKQITVLDFDVEKEEATDESRPRNERWKKTQEMDHTVETLKMFEWRQRQRSDIIRPRRSG